ncbi:major facilitator Superfamily [Seminavis robusta]|uniref:Major facilitator Superfamily n=1 Tax=Seminavis robusta TaxID=568900 RepID=A0A9N8DCI2_9STRA|nr:major facilitator Superfamily [Seminavis robusta]|eukprot:Sro89_g047070.1 major facilitator Superfamily (536) ;mRNA; r:97701-99405
MNSATGATSELFILGSTLFSLNDARTSLTGTTDADLEAGKCRESLTEQHKSTPSTPPTTELKSTKNQPNEALSMWVVRIAICADAMNSQVLGPNYPLLVLEEGSPESFISTDPLGFSGANYFIPMCSNLGMFFSAIAFGKLSDKIGRKPCILACMYIGVLGSPIKYAARGNFWTFCAATFFNGLFGGSAAVGMAYASDVTENRLQKEAQIGIMIATSMLGRTGGGATAILMESIGLFAPLWVSAAISFLAGVSCHMWMIETVHKNKPEETFEATKEADTPNCSASEASAGDKDSQNLHMKTLLHVLAGELADHVGSLGLVPLCLSPLMFNSFYVNFVEQNQDPIMSATAYKWIYIFPAVLVLPGAIVAPYLFKKFGPALIASLSNILTGAVTIALLHIAMMEPATTTTFAVFVAVLYIAFPLTVISQVSTGPMLDRIAPESRWGQIQGFNAAAMNLSSALGPFLYGLLTDATSIEVTLHTATGVSALAGLINAMLVKEPRFRPNNEEVEERKSAQNSYDEALISSNTTGIKEYEV